MACDASQTPLRESACAPRVVQFCNLCSDSLSNSIVNATSSWDNKVGKGIGAAMLVLLTAL